MAQDSLPAFADLLRRSRRAAGLSQEELAERAGLSARAVSDLERGVNRAPRRDTLEMLADALALPPDERRRWERLRQQQSLRSGTAVTTQPKSAPHLTSLPSQPTRFFGRETELSDLSSLFREDDVRLVTLTGPGGSGKTRLALQLATSLLTEYPDGAFFVDLAPVSNPALVLPTIAATLGIRPRADQPVGVTLATWLQGKRLLLVLDNLEQLLVAAPDIGELASRAGETRFLTTSRAPLRMRVEREFPLAPLPLPPTDDGADARAIHDSDAVRLFVDRARATRPTFDAAGEEALVVARICRRLDGLPLAIELAAASVRLLPPRAILARLEQQLPLPGSGPRDAPARQRTLRDTIAWSYALLGQDEQALLRRCSIFRGGWTLEAAKTVIGGDSDVLHGLATLVEHSLVQAAAGPADSPRFTMLETIREFGCAQLDAHGETDDTHHRHAAYFLQAFSESVEQLRSARFRSWLERGDAEVENLRLALEWSTRNDPELAIRLAREVGWYLLTRGAVPEARHRLEDALAAADEIPDELRAGALVDIGMYATTYGDFDPARAFIEQALALYRQLDDPLGVAICLHNLGRVAMWRGDFEEAEALIDAAVDDLRRADDSALTVTLANLGSTLLVSGKLDRAAAVLDEALAHGRRRGDIWACVVILMSQGPLERQRGDMQRAREAMRGAMQLHQELLDPRYIAQALEACAWFAVEDSAIERAAQLLGAASRLREEIGVPVLGNFRRDFEHYLPIAQAQLGAADWERAWSEGRALSQADAIEYALSGLTE
jgi:predicted ATPase/DNA-binding XRE family transcriptional regulator